MDSGLHPPREVQLPFVRETLPLVDFGDLPLAGLDHVLLVVRAFPQGLSDGLGNDYRLEPVLDELAVVGSGSDRQFVGFLHVRPPPLCRLLEFWATAQRPVRGRHLEGLLVLDQVLEVPVLLLFGAVLEEPLEQSARALLDVVAVQEVTVTVERGVEVVAEGQIIASRDQHTLVEDVPPELGLEQHPRPVDRLLACLLGVELRVQPQEHPLELLPLGRLDALHLHGEQPLRLAQLPRLDRQDLLSVLVRPLERRLPLLVVVDDGDLVGEPGEDQQRHRQSLAEGADAALVGAAVASPHQERRSRHLGPGVRDQQPLRSGEVLDRHLTRGLVLLGTSGLPVDGVAHDLPDRVSEPPLGLVVSREAGFEHWHC